MQNPDYSWFTGRLNSEVSSRLEDAFLRKYTKRDIAPWRDYVSVRYKPVHFVMTAPR